MSGLETTSISKLRILLVSLSIAHNPPEKESITYELLSYNNAIVDQQKFTNYLNLRTVNLETDDVNIFLSTLLILIFKSENVSLKIHKEDTNKLIIAGFFNTLLEEMNIKQFDFEVL